ncbi:putative aminoacyltransferase, E1 ubiquitin-activating enzyme [Lupinus albus]|uniref:U-box domain-containing protein n=1 Tax=Lupinus albus TaxID=3870 RepID=A0A6A4N558_LUPAL|nr:putative aminoacyltransferase, E1 ubiquitin-activating enzyme [Lupinus albus]
MKSPVSLCTGVTYDRSSIQRWLDNDFVPNRNLQSLIQIWSDSVQNRVDSPESKAVTESELVPSRDQVLSAIADVERHCENNRVDSLVKIVRFALDSDENRDFLAKVDGFVARLTERRRKQMQLLRFPASRFQRGSSGSKIASLRVLKSITMDAESKLLIAEKEGLVSELLNLIEPEKTPAVIENCLSCLIAISTPKRNKVKLVHLGAIRTFSKLLLESNLAVSIVEKVLKLLETMSSRKKGG